MRSISILSLNLSLPNVTLGDVINREWFLNTLYIVFLFRQSVDNSDSCAEEMTLSPSPPHTLNNGKKKTLCSFRSMDVPIRNL